MENAMNEKTIFDERKQAVGAQLMRNVYIWMTIGLALTGLVAWIVAQSPMLIQLAYDTPVLIGVAVGDFIIVLLLAFFLKKIKFITAFIGYILFSIFNGILCSGIFLSYELSSVGFIFFISAAMFAALAFIGTMTKRDLSAMRVFLTMLLTGLVLASVITLLTGNAQSLLISAVGVFVFSGLTVVDAQKIRMELEKEETINENNMKLALFGALNLYLDFINLFLKLLELFGKVKDKK